jgi:hypothetical protein
MRAQVGDRIVIDAKTVGHSGRSGVIEEVMQEDPPRYSVRWDDGRVTIFAPAGGVARIEPQKKRRTKTT